MILKDILLIMRRDIMLTLRSADVQIEASVSSYISLEAAFKKAKNVIEEIIMSSHNYLERMDTTVIIRFTFNGVICEVSRDSDWGLFMKQYNQLVQPLPLHKATGLHKS